MPEHRVLNCVPSQRTERDWTFEDAVKSGLISDIYTPPESVDLRERWWGVDNQGQSGACVGYATAYGVLRWLYVKAGIMPRNQKPSARFIWMANKETDELINYPSTFLEVEGTQTKLALDVVRKYGCVTESDLPMYGGLSVDTAHVFYTKASQYRISSYHNLGTNQHVWKQWLATQGPILTRLEVDKAFINASQTNGIIDNYDRNTVDGGHAVCFVGYTPEYFIVRNSWGTGWGNVGYGFVTAEYAANAFTEAYGAIL
jgi:hypothetical protein